MDLNNSNNCSSTNNNNNTTTTTSNDTLDVSSILLNYDNCSFQSTPLSIVSDNIEPFKENCCNNNNDVKNVKT